MFKSALLKKAMPWKDNEGRSDRWPELGYFDNQDDSISVPEELADQVSKALGEGKRLRFSTNQSRGTSGKTEPIIHFQFYTEPAKEKALAILDRKGFIVDEDSGLITHV